MDRYTVLEYQVSKKISFLEERVRTIADEIVEVIMDRVDKEYFLSLLLQLREFMRISKGSIEQLEIMFELMRMEVRAATAKMKTKPGRPKKEKPEQYQLLRVRQ